MDISWVVDEYFDLHDDQPEQAEPEPEIDRQAAFEYVKTCEHKCKTCPFLHIRHNASRAVCPATGEIVGEDELDLACGDHFMRLYDGEYTCDGCDHKTPGCGDSALILCVSCQRKLGEIIGL